jgi:DNA-binding Lrp family transcriptional regulator
MVVPFYMLIRTKKGQSFSVVKAIEEIIGVEVVYSVTGSYDVILYAIANDLPDLRRIREAVQQINAVTRTETAVHT